MDFGSNNIHMCDRRDSISKREITNYKQHDNLRQKKSNFLTQREESFPTCRWMGRESFEMPEKT